jgi:hypothetical protein
MTSGKIDLFVGSLMTAHELMRKKGRVMESGTIVEDDGTQFSYKIKTLKQKYKTPQTLQEKGN